MIGSEELEGLKEKLGHIVDGILHEVEGKNTTETSTTVLQDEAAPSSASGITAQADPSILSTDHSLDTSIAEVVPVQSRLVLLLENFIHNIDTPMYQEEVAALRELQSVASGISSEAHNVLADVIHFTFKDK